MIKGQCADNKIPKGLLIKGIDAVKDAVEVFHVAKNFDVINEKIPDIVVPSFGNLSKKSVNAHKNKPS